MAMVEKRRMEEKGVFRDLDGRIGVGRVIGAGSAANIDRFSLVASWLAGTFLHWMKEKTE